MSNILDDGKNARNAICLHCPCKILLAGDGSHQKFEEKLPAEDGNETCTVKTWWQVDDMYSFYNIGFSKTVANKKYLVCADCERGPIGYHDLDTKKSYLATEMVGYSQ